MAARRTPPPSKGAYYPPSEHAVYRDLLLFEERLKTNASVLRKRKSRYQLFLLQLLAVIVLLAAEVFLQTQLVPLILIYALKVTIDADHSEYFASEVHQYAMKGLLLVAATTLVLFFASGLYEEKIAYANRYVPHANRALRSFNMYLNVRHKPLRTRLLVNPLTFFSHRSAGHDDDSIRSPSPERRRKRGTSVPIPPIPPTNNPRGELIFSSRVDRGFREAYERYRAAFERKREAREAFAAAQMRWGWRWRYWPWNWGRAELTALSAANGPPRHTRGQSPSPSAVGTPRGRGSDSESTTTTPSASRRSSPVPGSPGQLGQSKGMEGRGELKNRRTTMPNPSSLPQRLMPERERKDSYSFLLTNDQSFR